jgi:hypothetical protein
MGLWGARMKRFVSCAVLAILALAGCSSGDGGASLPPIKYRMPTPTAAELARIDSDDDVDAWMQEKLSKADGLAAGGCPGNPKRAVDIFSEDGKLAIRMLCSDLGY